MDVEKKPFKSSKKEVLTFVPSAALTATSIRKMSKSQLWNAVCEKIQEHIIEVDTSQTGEINLIVSKNFENIKQSKYFLF